MDVPDEGDEGRVKDSMGAKVPGAESEPAREKAASSGQSRLRSLQKPIILIFLGCIAIYLLVVIAAAVASMFGSHPTPISR